jgi:flagellar M-ring protein FliF
MTDGAPRISQGSPVKLSLAIAAAFAAAVLLFGLWYFLVRTPYATAFADLKTDDAALIIQDLKRQKIPFQLSDNGTSILVPNTQVDATRISILGGDLPLKGTVGFELFNKNDMGLTEFAQKINYQRALQGELARTLMAMDNIESARVHLSLPNTDVFERDRRIAKASVTIVTKFGRVLEGASVAGIQRLVASATPELEPQNVAILGASGQLLTLEVQPIAAPISPDSARKMAMEQFYAAQILEVIQPVLSDPQTRVVVLLPMGADTRILPQAETAGAQSSDQRNDSDQSTKLPRRSFPLTISIALPIIPDPVQQDRVTALLQQTVGFDPKRGDSLKFTTPTRVTDFGDVMPEKIERQTPAAAPHAVRTQENLFSGLGNWVIFILAGCAFAGLMWIAAQRLRRRKMTTDQRDDFAARLKTLLAEEEYRPS